MAKVTRETFDDTKNYKRVTIQLGTPFLDNEANEAQEIQQANLNEGLLAVQSDTRACVDTRMRFGFAKGDEFLAYANGGDSKIWINAGTLTVDGMRLVLSADLDLTTAGLSWSTVGGSRIYGLLYADIVLSEVDSSIDPNIAASQIGETSVRKAFTATWHKEESTVSFDAAFSNIAALSNPANATVWKGYTVRIFIARYSRAPSATSINAADLVDLRQQIPGERGNVGGQRFIKTLRGSGIAGDGPLYSDGMIWWDYVNKSLIVGVANASATITATEIGAKLTMAGAPAQYFASTTGVIWLDVPAVGTGSGTPVVPDSAKGYLIDDGAALGWRSDATEVTHFLLTKGLTNQSKVYEVTPAPASYTLANLLVQKLIVDTVSTFDNDPSSFILCRRVANDLIWYNGQVTRGQLLGKFDEIGAHPSPYDAICSVGGAAGTYEAHVTGIDALERALNFTTEGRGATNTLGKRTFRYFCRGGILNFARGIKKYGLTSEMAAMSEGYDADNNRLEVIGDGPETVSLKFRNTVTSGRSASDLGVVTFVGNVIVFKGVTFDQVHDSTYNGSYYVIIGNHVVLEDCHFNGPVWVQADRITVRNCRFLPLTNTTRLFPSGATGNPLTAQHLYLSTRTAAATTRANWRIEGNYFNVGTCVGSHVSLLLGCTSDITHAIVIKDNLWHYEASANADDAAIHVDGPYAHIEIAHNRFEGACGVAKVGNITGDTSPFDGNYNGAPLSRDLADTQIYALGYISVITTRHYKSKLDVHHNYFDLSNITEGSVTGRFVVWGAMMCVFNFITWNTATGSMANISFTDNDVLMELSATATGWGAGGANPQIASWGFYLAPTWQDGHQITQLLVDNVKAVNNRFDLGLPSATTKIWRGIAATNIQSWPGSGGYLTDTSVCIGIVLKNCSTAVGGFNYDGRSATNIVVKSNQISQRELGNAAPTFGTISVGDNNGTGNHPRWWPTVIALDITQNHWSTNGALTEAAAPEYELNQGEVIFAPEVSDNRVDIPAYLHDDGTQTMAGILVGGAYMGNIHDNRVYMDATTTTTSGTGFWGIVEIGGARNLLSDNNIKARWGIGGSTTDYAADNVAYGAAVVASAPIVTETSNNFP